MEVSHLTFNRLSDLVEENKFENEDSRRVAELILNAQRDWRTPTDTVIDFVKTLQKEINGQVSESNLKKLLGRYNRDLSKYAWESESVSYLLDIFKRTEKSDLNYVLVELNKKIIH